MKGGVCKTTLCKEMALFLSETMGKSVLIIDIDPQSNCTQSFFEKYKILDVKDDEIIMKKSEIPSIEKIFSPSKGKLYEATCEEVIYELTNTLHIIPGELHTVFMERETSSGVSEQRLFNFVEDNELKDKYDYIFIDCPPTYSFYTIAALLASDFYFVPVVPDAYSLLGVSLLEDVVKHLKNSYKSNFKIKPLDNLGIIFTKIAKNPNAGIQRNIKQIRETLEDEIYCFENTFLKADKVITSKLSVFITDRNDSNMILNLKNVCTEFKEMVDEYNG